MLSRILNSFIKGVNASGKFPRYIVVILDDDLVMEVSSIGFGVSTVIGEWIKYLAQNMADIVEQHKKALPAKAIKNEYPMILLGLQLLTIVISN